MPNLVKNIILVSLLLEHSFEIKRKGNSGSIYYFNEFYDNIFIDNGLLFLSLNDNIFHIDQMKKRKREDVNIIYL